MTGNLPPQEGRGTEWALVPIRRVTLVLYVAHTLHIFATKL
jgi:hypothetical protein